VKDAIEVAAAGGHNILIFDIREPIPAGASDDVLRQLLLDVVARKPKKHDSIEEKPLVLSFALEIDAAAGVNLQLFRLGTVFLDK
jgi:hypothetical protein